MRVANLDMTDHSQHCPAEFNFNNRSIAPFRTCGRVGPAGCVSTTYSIQFTILNTPRCVEKLKVTNSAHQTHFTLLTPINI